MSILAPIAKRLGRTRLARQALEEQADLSAFKPKPTPRFILGMFLIAFSYVIGWPAVALMGGLSMSLNKPWIGVVGGGLIYGLSYLVLSLGMILAGTVYTQYLFRRVLRAFVEKYHPSTPR